MTELRQRRHAVKVAILLLAGLLTLPTLLQAREVIYVRMTAPSYSGDRALNHLRELSDSAPVHGVVREGSVPTSSPLARWARVDASNEAEAQRLVAAYQQDPEVEVVERMPKRTTCGLLGGQGGDGVALDPLNQFQWYLNEVNAWSAWDRVPDASSVTVAVLDNGCDMNHPDLVKAFWTNEAEANGQSGVDDDGNGFIDDLHGYDFFDGDNNPDAPNQGQEPSHGTHCAGIIGATVNNGVGISGIAPGVRLMIVRIGEDRDIYYPVEGMIYAAQNGADVVSMSFSGELSSVFERDAVEYATSRGVVVLAAAGNNGVTTRNFPAGYDHVIAVGATGPDGALASFSNRGDWVDLAAPGTGILSTSINGYKYLDGTSMATPLTAGIVALVRAQSPLASPEAVRARLGQGAIPLTVTPDAVNAGRVDAWRATLDRRPIVIVNGISVDDSNGNGNGIVEPGESVTLLYDLDLAGANADSLILVLRSRDADITVTNDTLRFTSLSAGPLNQASFAVEVGTSATRGNHDLYLSADADGWRDVQRTTFAIDPHWRVHDAGGMIATFTDFGAIGYRDVYNNRDDAPGIRLDDAPRGVLFHGSVVVSNGTYVSDCAYGNDAQTRFDFQNLSTNPIRPVGAATGYQVFQAKYTDFGTSPRVGVEVSQTTTSQPEGENVVRVDLDVRKWDTGTDSYDVGIYMDWDIGDAATNNVRYNPDLKLSYMTGTEGAAGVMPVANDQNSTPFVAAAAIYNPDVVYHDYYDSFTDQEKLDLLASGTTQSISDFSGDWSHLIAVHLSDVTAQVSLRASFLVLAAASEDELLQIAQSQAASTIQSGGAGATLVTLPAAFDLTSAWPNPFNGETRLLLRLLESGHVQVAIYDILGRRVAVLEDGTMGAGTVNLRWNGRNSEGSPVASGVYLVRATVQGREAIRRITLIR